MKSRKLSNSVINDESLKEGEIDYHNYSINYIDPNNIKKKFDFHVEYKKILLR